MTYKLSKQDREDLEWLGQHMHRPMTWTEIVEHYTISWKPLLLAYAKSKMDVDAQAAEIYTRRVGQSMTVKEEREH